MTRRRRSTAERIDSDQRIVRLNERRAAAERALTRRAIANMPVRTDSFRTLRSPLRMAIAHAPCGFAGRAVHESIGIT